MRTHPLRPTGGFRLLHLRRFRSHLGRTLLSITGISVGVALVAAILALQGSLLHSVEQLVELAGRADVQVSGVGDTGFDEDVFFEVAETEGVEAAVPVIRSTVSVGGEEIVLFGFDERAEALDEELADRARAETSDQETNGIFLSRELADDLGLAEGDPTAVYGFGTETRTRVVGVLDDLGSSVNRGRFAVAALPLAQQFAGKAERLDIVWAVAADGTSPAALEARIDDRVGRRAVVSSPRLQAEQASAEVDPLRQQLLVIAGAVLVVAAFLVYNTMSMAALERRRELATLRALGGTRGPLLRGFMGEAAILGAAGAALGLVGGVVVARLIVDALPPLVSSGLGTDATFHLPGSTVPIAIATGVVATVVAALVPARRAVAVPPVEAMRPEGALETGREGDRVVWPVAVGGMVAVAAGAAMTAGLVSGVVIPGAALLVVGGIVTTWGFTAPITTSAAWLARRAHTAGALAAASLGRAPRRTWATTTGVAVAVALVVAVGGLVANERATFHDQFAPLRDMDVVVQGAPLDDFPDTLLPPRWRDDLAAIPGVAGVYEGQFAFATIDDRRTIVQGFERGAHEPFVRLADDTARRRMLAGEGVIVTREFGRVHGVAESDVLPLSTPAGLQRARILDEVGFVGGGLSGGMVGLSVDRVQEWFDRAGASWFELEVEEGISVGSVMERVREFTEGAPFPVFVASGDEVYDAAVGISEQFDVAFMAMAWIAVVAGALGILNTIMLSVLERRRELGILRAMGTSRRQVWRMVLVEATTIAVLGTLIGSALGLVMHWAGVQGADDFAGLPIEYAPTAVPLAAAALVALVMSAVGGIGPGRRAARVNVIAAIGYE